MIITNKYNLPNGLYRILNKEAGFKRVKNEFSVSELIDPPQKVQLTRRYWEYLEQDASEFLWALLGKTIHMLLQKNQIEGLTEEKLKQEVEGVVIRGRVDLIYEEEGKLKIADWKITSVWAMRKAKKEWEEQLKFYAWLLYKIGFKVEDLAIFAILRDWTYGERQRYKDYPLCPFIEKHYEVPVFEDLEKEIVKRVLLHKEAQELEDDKLPPCSKEERWWNEREKKYLRCENYCLVKKFCVQYKIENNKTI